MDSNSVLSKIPNPLLLVLAAIGFVSASSKIVSYVRLLLSLFVLGGKNVSCLLDATGMMISDPATASTIWQKRKLGSHNRSFRRHWERICHSTRAERIQPRPSLPNRIQTPNPRTRDRTEICWVTGQMQDSCHGFLEE